MSYEEDYIMRQIRGIGDLILRLIGKEYMDEELRDIFTEDGQLRESGAYVEQLIRQEKFQAVNQIILRLQFKLSLHSHNALVEKYIKTLENLPPDVRERNHLTKQRLISLEKDLKNFV